MSKMTYSRYDHGNGEPTEMGERPSAPAETVIRSMCKQVSPQDTEGLVWVCTRTKGHEGQHVAHAVTVPYAAWID